MTPSPIRPRHSVASGGAPGGHSARSEFNVRVPRRFRVPAASRADAVAVPGPFPPRAEMASRPASATTAIAASDAAVTRARSVLLDIDTPFVRRYPRRRLSVYGNLE